MKGNNLIIVLPAKSKLLANIPGVVKEEGKDLGRVDIFTFCFHSDLFVLLLDYLSRLTFISCNSC